MKLYLLSQSENNSYDTHDSMVVVAPSAEEAVQYNPDGKKSWGASIFSTWASKPENVVVEEIGIASTHLRRGEVICASFNAG